MMSPMISGASFSPSVASASSFAASSAPRAGAVQAAAGGGPQNSTGHTELPQSTGETSDPGRTVGTGQTTPARNGTQAAGSGASGAGSPAAVYQHTSSSGDANRAPDGKRVAAARVPSQTPQQQQQVVAKLSARDAHVRAHEAAHIAAGGSLIRGGASYSFERGPDGKSYAVGGEVSIDTSPVSGNPRATITKMETVRAAALAPGDPSSADLSVAGAAAEMEAQALSQLSQLALSQPTQQALRHGTAAYKASSAGSRPNGSTISATA
jgi:hypothetical protein